MRMIQATCKLCRRPAVAQWEDYSLTQEEIELTQEAVDKFLPMLTCDQCYDRMEKRNRSGRAILDACFLLARQDHPTEKIIGAVRTTLERATKQYAEVMADTYNKAEVMWTPDFVSMLIRQPLDASRILANYRKNLRAAAQ